MEPTCFVGCAARRSVCPAGICRSRRHHGQAQAIGSSGRWPCGGLSRLDGAKQDLPDRSHAREAPMRADTRTSRLVRDSLGPPVRAWNWRCRWNVSSPPRRPPCRTWRTGRTRRTVRPGPGMARSPRGPRRCPDLNGAVGRGARWPREPRTRELRVLGGGVSSHAGLSQPRLGRASGKGDGTPGALRGAQGRSGGPRAPRDVLPLTSDLDCGT